MKETSKFLSHVLRHAPESIGLALDGAGWAHVDELLAKAQQSGRAIDRDILLAVVATSDKKRFSLSEDGTRIRAAQGHSVTVDLGLQPAEPPPILYHGTSVAAAPQIMTEGLRPQARQHVHLSSDRETARRVGQRHGRPVVLIVDAAGMRREEIDFFQADNGVWLTAHVPPSFLSPAGDGA